MRIVLILPAIGSGGLERVITELANYFSGLKKTEVFLISLMKGDLFYETNSKVTVIKPGFGIKEMPRFFYAIRLFIWVRYHIKNKRPDAVLSFGARFNSFIILTTLGLRTRTYISDRGQPGKSNGKFIDTINLILYPLSTGIIAQTSLAKEAIERKIHHKNITVIGNPVKRIEYSSDKENIILNVGRFIESKQQDLLVTYFSRIRHYGYKLVFIGEGKTMANVRKLVNELHLNSEVEFLTSIRNIEEYYKKSKIFAFVSRSEGYPNALGEAMSAGMACLSFDCKAGPCDLIEDGVSGFLIEENDHNSYISKLERLIKDENLQRSFGHAAIKKIQVNNPETIGNRYYMFISGVNEIDN